MSIQDLIEEVQKLSADERKQLIQAIVLMDNAEVNAGHAHSLLDLVGLGSEIWSNVDAQTYIDDLRDEWDDRL